MYIKKVFSQENSNVKKLYLSLLQINSPADHAGILYMNALELGISGQEYYHIESDRPKEECGIFGIYFPHPDFSKVIVRDTLTGLLANQHRGEESAGIVVANGRKVSEVFKRMGWVTKLYDAYKTLGDRRKKLFEGHIAISHARYSTTGSSNLDNAAPFRFQHKKLGAIAVAHNGNITNAEKLKQELVSKGIQFKSTTDSEVIGALIVHSNGNTWEEKIASALKQLEGSFSLILCTKDTLFAARDAIGNRPLSIAEFRTDGLKGFAISSESGAFTNLDISYKREITPGELLVINKKGSEQRYFATENPPQAFCALEAVYLMRPDARLGNDGVQLDTIRRHLGEKLAKLYPPPEGVDFVTYIPESAKQAAEGYAKALSKTSQTPVLSFTGMLKNRYGTIEGGLRGFIQPGKSHRERVAKSYSPYDILLGAKIVLVDDSIIRGTTTAGVIETIKKNVGDLRDGGSEQIHLRIVFPPVIGFCPLGTDINIKDTLLAKQHPSIEEMRKYLGVDSLAFLTPEQFQEGVNETIQEKYGLCLGCTTGKYPVTIFQADKTIFERESVKQ